MPGRATDTSRARGAVQRAVAQQAPGGVPASRPANLRERIAGLESAFQAAMPRGMESRLIIRDALNCLNRTRFLDECTADSVLGALMTCAQLGLRPGVPALGHAWILPFYDGQGRDRVRKAQLIIGYQGYADLAHRTGAVKSLIARSIHEKDYYEVHYGLRDELIHRPADVTTDRGSAIAYYCIVKLNSGGHSFLVMSRPEVEKHRDKFAMARKGGKIVGPWVDHFDSMARKTTWLQVARWIPKTPELSHAMSVDEQVLELDPNSLEIGVPLWQDGSVIDAADSTPEPPPAVESPPQEPAPEPPAGPTPDQQAEEEHKAELQRKARESFGDG